MTNRPYLYSIIWTKRGAEVRSLSVSPNLQSVALARKSFIYIVNMCGPKGEPLGLYTDRTGSAISNGRFGENRMP